MERKRHDRERDYKVREEVQSYGNKLLQIVILI